MGVQRRSYLVSPVVGRRRRRHPWPRPGHGLLRRQQRDPPSRLIWEQARRGSGWMKPKGCRPIWERARGCRTTWGIWGFISRRRRRGARREAVVSGIEFGPTCQWASVESPEEIARKWKAHHDFLLWGATRCRSWYLLHNKWNSDFGATRSESSSVIVSIESITRSCFRERILIYKFN
jgi:hypothetical protein